MKRKLGLEIIDFRSHFDRFSIIFDRFSIFETRLSLDDKTAASPLARHALTPEWLSLPRGQLSCITAPLSTQSLSIFPARWHLLFILRRNFFFCLSAEKKRNKNSIFCSQKKPITQTHLCSLKRSYKYHCRYISNIRKNITVVTFDTEHKNVFFLQLLPKPKKKKLL